MNERKQTIRKIQQLHKGRKPLNIAAVKRHSPELIEVAYRQDPYWGWRCALEDAGVDYDTINVEVLDYVVCRICGAELGALGGLHLQHLHNMYPSEYQQEFPGAEMRSEKLRCFHPGAKLILPHWEPFMTPEYALDRIWAFHRMGLPLNQKYCPPLVMSGSMMHSWSRWGNFGNWSVDRAGRRWFGCGRITGDSWPPASGTPGTSWRTSCGCPGRKSVRTATRHGKTHFVKCGSASTGKPPFDKRHGPGKIPLSTTRLSNSSAATIECAGNWKHTNF